MTAPDRTTNLKHPWMTQRARQARAKAAQRDLVPGTDMTPQQLAQQQRALKAETRERQPGWFA